MAVHWGPNIVTDSLYTLLDARDPASYPGSGTTWYDISGNGKNATLSAAAIGTDVPGQMTFTSGNSEFATISHDTNFAYSATANWSVSMWYMVTGTNSGFTWSKRNGSSTYIDAQHGAGDNKQNWGLKTSGGTDSLQTTAVIVDDGSVAYNVAWVHEGSTDKIYFYVNGVLNASTTKSNATSGNYSTSDIYIGKIINQEYITGNIWSFIGYTKALSAKEALQNFNAERSFFSNAYGL
jgi:hypothetical protein